MLQEHDLQSAAEQFEAVLREASVPDWLGDMDAEFAATGNVRTEHLRRLIGDPGRRVAFGGDASDSSFFVE